jgi:hypothetical protein
LGLFYSSRQSTSSTSGVASSGGALGRRRCDRERGKVWYAVLNMFFVLLNRSPKLTFLLVVRVRTCSDGHQPGFGYWARNPRMWLLGVKCTLNDTRGRALPHSLASLIKAVHYLPSFRFTIATSFTEVFGVWHWSNHGGEYFTETKSASMLTA